RTFSGAPWKSGDPWVSQRSAEQSRRWRCFGSYGCAAFAGLGRGLWDFREDRRASACTLVSIDPDDPAFLDRQRQPTVVPRKRRLAEQLAAPAVQRGYVGIIVSGNLLEIVDRCDHLAGDAVALRCHPQQNLQKLDDC